MCNPILVTILKTAKKMQRNKIQCSHENGTLFSLGILTFTPPSPPPLYVTCIHELKMYVFRRFYLVGKPGPKDVEVNPSC